VLFLTLKLNSDHFYLVKCLGIMESNYLKSGLLTITSSEITNFDTL
jgi:hypothetical protein